MNYRTIFGFILFSLWSLAACQTSSSQQKECPKGAPTPIYSSDYKKVLSHSFEREEQNSTEKIQFQNNTELTIRQSGCQAIRQVFEFTFPKDSLLISHGDLLAKATDKFSYLAGIEEKFYSFRIIASKLEELKPRFKRSKAFEIDPGFFIQIDKISFPDQDILEVVLFEKEDL